MLHLPHLLLFELGKTHRSLSRTRQIHALLTTLNLIPDSLNITRIVRFYALNNDISSARNLFDRTLNRSVYLWNSIIRAYTTSRNLFDSLSLFRNMILSETKPDNFTYACIIRSCYENSDLSALRILHTHPIVSGMGSDSVVCSALMTAYSKLGKPGNTRKLFDRILEPDLVLCNCMISCNSGNGFWRDNLILLNKMQVMFLIKPDGHTFVGLISGLNELTAFPLGQGIHGLCLRIGFFSNSYVISALVSMYSRFGFMHSAYRVYTCLQSPDFVTCSSLISGYSRCGEFDKALLLFRNMKTEKKKKMVDDVLIACILSSLAQSANPRPGKEIHGHIVRHGFTSSIKALTALMDMYMKCGLVNIAARLFEKAPKRNTVMYNSMILGLGLNGFFSRAFSLFKELLDEGLTPDESTLSALLCTCSHSGLVEEGEELFLRMTDVFKIEHKAEHHVHMVRLLGGVGQLERAYEFVLSLKQPVDSGVWGALLSCCDACGNSSLAEIVAYRLMDREPSKGAYKVMLSNCYAGNGRWDYVENLRDVDLRKMTGISRISIG